MAYTDWTPSPTSNGAVPVMVNNRRRVSRKMVMRDGVLTPYGNAPIEAMRVVVVDVANVGIGLRCRQALPDGSVYHLSIPTHPDYDNTRVRVVRSRPSRGGQFEVGAEFC
jgi:hypothetical protein